MHHNKSHLHGGCLVNSVTLKTATAVSVPLWQLLRAVARVFETVPELRDRLAVILGTLTNPEHSMAGRRSTTSFHTLLTTRFAVPGLPHPFLAHLSDSLLYFGCPLHGWAQVVQTRGRSADIRFSPSAFRATLWCPAGSTAFGEHIQAHRCHIVPVPWRNEQAGLPGSLHLAVLIFVTPPQVAFTQQTCLSLCML